MKKTSVEFFASGLDHPEGLAFAPDGTLWAGGEGGQLYRISPDGKSVETVVNIGGFCLGLVFGPDGWLYVCNHKLPAIVRVNPATGEHRIFADQVEGQRVRVPNAAVFDQAGNLYVSNSGDWGQRTGEIYRFSPDGRGQVVARGLAYANGVAISPDGREFFVVQSTEDNILSLPIAADGKLGPASLFAEKLAHVPDGITFHTDGDLYCSCYGGHNAIYCINSNGGVRLVVDDPQGIALNRPTNVAFSADGQLYAANLGGYHISRIALP